eukprot:581382-Heterocapsa_arctica.AAC.1
MIALTEPEEAVIEFDADANLEAEMQREAEVEEYERRPPWYMTPEQHVQLAEEMRQQDEEIEQRLAELREVRLRRRRG